MSQDNTTEYNDFIPTGTAAGSAGPTGEIPRAIYQCRITDASAEASKKSGHMMIVLSSEILTPDAVPSIRDPGTICNPAGRKFKMYAIIDPASAQQENGKRLLAKLNLLHPSGNISPAYAVNTAKLGTTFFMVVLEGEETYHRVQLPPGVKGEAPFLLNPITGQKIPKGFEIKLPGEKEVVSICGAPEGYVHPQF